MQYNERISRKRELGRKGKGLVNKLINKLPFEVHLPGYNFCGPGTKLEKRLSRGDSGINVLDEACKEHDIVYSETNNLKERHEADKRLYKVAKKRITSSKASVGEKAASLTVAGLMKVKTAVGMGHKRKRVQPKKFRRRRRMSKGGALSFSKAVKIAKHAISRSPNKNLLRVAKIAYNVLKRNRRGISKPRRRAIPIPKQGGFLPLIPLFAALGALGSLGGGAAAIAKAVNDASAAKEKQKEEARHNRVMEAKAIGSGFYIKPYKKGCGLYLGNTSKN